MYENIITSKEATVLTITINRESKLNALNMATLREIKEAIIEANKDKEVSGIILTGSGAKAFAAGADISEFVNFNSKQATKMSADGHETMNTIERSGKPVIAAVNGFALGGGCELAMSCHVRIASENAKFGQPEVNLGVPPGYGGTQRLIQLVGKSKATELLLTADAIGANVAMEYGLVNEVVPIEDLIPRCIEILNKISSKSPMAVAAVIRCINAHFEDGVDGLKTEIDEFGKAFDTIDFKEGTDAFLNKRKANFER
ncbi:MAG: enoyl-CoA hydratase/isomerase family protein [Bacteroidia bacterium]|nr:enoyl-CoA hydratase/isomerase family protein [Bacteroidia bacterium]